MPSPILSRVWAMPSPQTFSIPPIGELLDRWLAGRQVVVDPFANACTRGTVTNDLDPKQPTQYHLEAVEFCAVIKAAGCLADAVLFDPPYSPRQISESYKSVGLPVGMAETQNGRFYKAVRDGLDAILLPGAVAVSCGWNSGGFGTTRGYTLVEILLVAHGGAHNDTIVTVETKN
jgi:hypothetical protein